jgi:hypothetical protein
MRDIAMNWDWLGSRPAWRTRREEARERVHAQSEPPPAVDIRMASGSVVRISFDQTTQRMSFGRVRS